MACSCKPETENTGSAGSGKNYESDAGRLAGLASLVSQLYENSDAAQFDISASEFSQILSEITDKYLSSECDQAAVRELLSKLHAKELILARACAAGHSKAWETLLTRYRDFLYQTAISIAKDEAIGRELADSLYADLYSSESRAGRRMSKLNSYTGVGTLTSWLCTVLVRAYIDRYRSEKRLVSLDETMEEDPRLITAASEVVVSVDPRLEDATDEALSSLSPEDGYILVSHFLDGRTLADIASSLNVHESTASRRVEKITSRLRNKVVAALRRRGMSRAQAEEALQADVRDLQLKVRERLQKTLQERHTGSFS
jgi:RNA polymerase sigma-70 factor (ECF subfamily)